MGTRRLTLLRHGQAQPLDSCPDDFERVLTRRGIIEAQEMAERLAHRDLAPDLILVSPAERAWTTASIVAQTCDLQPECVQGVRELYLALPETIWRVLRKRGGSHGHVLVCAHNPGLSQIASRFGPHLQARELPTAGLATALWENADWSSLEPETACECDLDDPESMADLWS